jgi:hypothetical protein
LNSGPQQILNTGPQQILNPAPQQILNPAPQINVEDQTAGDTAAIRRNQGIDTSGNI